VAWRALGPVRARLPGHPQQGWPVKSNWTTVCPSRATVLFKLEILPRCSGGSKFESDMVQMLAALLPSLSTGDEASRHE